MGVSLAGTVDSGSSAKFDKRRWDNMRVETQPGYRFFYKRLRTPQLMSKGSNAKALAGMVNSDVVPMLKIRFSCERIGQFYELGNPLAGMVDPGIGTSPNWGIP